MHCTILYNCCYSHVRQIVLLFLSPFSWHHETTPFLSFSWAYLLRESTKNAPLAGDEDRERKGQKHTWKIEKKGVIFKRFLLKGDILKGVRFFTSTRVQLVGGLSFVLPEMASEKRKNMENFFLLLLSSSLSPFTSPVKKVVRKIMEGGPKIRKGNKDKRAEIEKDRKYSPVVFMGKESRALAGCGRLSH